MIPNLVDAIELQAKAKSDCPGRQTVGKIPGSPRGQTVARAVQGRRRATCPQNFLKDGCEFSHEGRSTRMNLFHGVHEVRLLLPCRRCG